MKRNIDKGLLLALLVICMTAFTWKKADKYILDIQKSKITWQAGKIVGGDHKGEIPFASGSFLAEDKALVGGEFLADVNGLKVTDLSGSGAERLAGHLKNQDFFETDKHPTARFKIATVTYNGKEQATITGNLTIKDITKPLTFTASVHVTDNQIHAVAQGVKVDRTQYNVKYRSGNFFSDLGDKAIKDEFTLDIELFASKQ